MTDTLFTFAHVADTHLYDETDSPVYRGRTLDVVTPLIESLNAEKEHRYRISWCSAATTLTVASAPRITRTIKEQSARRRLGGSKGFWSA